MTYKLNLFFMHNLYFFIACKIPLNYGAFLKIQLAAANFLKPSLGGKTCLCKMRCLSLELP